MIETSFDVCESETSFISLIKALKYNFAFIVMLISYMSSILLIVHLFGSSCFSSVLLCCVAVLEWVAQGRTSS